MVDAKQKESRPKEKSQAFDLKSIMQQNCSSKLKESQK
jgi:hypothetical protein